jgi:hypothetical protein
MVLASPQARCKQKKKGKTMDQVMVFICTTALKLVGFIQLLSMRLGEALMQRICSKGKSRTASSNAQSAPTQNAMSANQALASLRNTPQTERRGVYKLADVEEKLRAQGLEPDAVLAQIRAPAVQPQDAAIDQAVPEAEAPFEDDLDWAGSLSHAMVANMHFSQLLAMVRQGWLVPNVTRHSEVYQGLEVLSAFEERTTFALAPWVSAMNDAQQTQFFEGFEELLPPELEGLESIHG